MRHFFLPANANKHDLTLDLNQPVGRDLVLQLVAQADLVVENFTPRVLEQFDLDWDVIHAANPRAVMVRMPAFGLTGPWRDRPGFAQTMEQVTGHGLADRPRRRPAAHPARPVRPQRRHARGDRRARRRWPAATAPATAASSRRAMFEAALQRRRRDR